MGAARKVWDDTKNKVKVLGWQSKIKLEGDFGARLDALEKLDREFESKVKSLHSDIEKINAVAASVKDYGKFVGNALTSTDANFLPREQREHLLLVKKAAMRESRATVMKVLDEPLRELCSVIADLIDESWCG